MTLQEILNTVLLKYPHSYTNADVISIINRIQKELFRTLYKPETTSQYDLIADNPFYAIDYSPQNIIEVVVNGCEYKRDNIRYASCGSFYYVLDENTLGIFPTPTEDVEGGLVVFRYAEPRPLTTSDLGLEPDFDRDWHMIIVNRVCKELAEYSHDGDFVNVFVGQIIGLEDEYKRTKIHQPYEIQNVFGGYLM